MKLSDEQRARWADGLRQRPSADGCPSDETIWSAIAGELDDVRTRQVVDHLSRCGPCNTSWQLAREMHGELIAGAVSEGALDSIETAALDEIAEVAPASPATVAEINPWVPRVMAIAATLLLAFVAYPVVREMLTQPTLDPSFRSSDATVLTAVDSEETPLSRNACVLRWQGAPAGSLYAVTISDATGAMSWTVRGLQEPELIIPAERLEAVESGGQLLWQVEATLPDGQKQESLTFVHTLE